MEPKRRRTRRNGNNEKPRIAERANGQDRNLPKIVRMLDDPDTAEKLKAVAQLSSNKLALAYVGALHKDRDVREAALNMLEDPYCVLVIAKSSHYKNSVDGAFEKLGKMIDRIEDINVVCSVMLHTHEANSKYKAYLRIKEYLKTDDMINYFDSFGTIEGTLHKPSVKSNRVMHFEGVSVETLEHSIAQSVPYTFEEVKKRGIIDPYSGEKLSEIIEKS